MNINNENIEEYLLLLVDNELTAAEQEAVLLFIEDKEEYQILLAQFRSTLLEIDDTIVFENKESLLKPEAKTIPFIKQKQLLKYAAAVIAIIGIGLLFRAGSMKNDVASQNPVTVATLTKSIDTNTIIKQQTIASATSKQYQLPSPSPKVASDKKKQNRVLTTKTPPAIPVRSKQIMPEQLAMADIRDIEMPEQKATANLYAITDDTDTQPETKKWLFIDDENLIGVHDLINQVSLLKESIQTKTRELKNFSIAIRIGNKDVNLLN